MRTCIALDRRTGKPVWDATVEDFKVGYAITQAPLIVKDKVIVGIAGGDIPTRGFVDAYDPKTGARVWRFYTIPAPGEPGSETWSDAVRAAARRRRHVADRQLRSAAQSSLLGRRQPESRLLRRGSQGRHWYLAEDLVQVLARRRKDWISLLTTNFGRETAVFSCATPTAG